MGRQRRQTLLLLEIRLPFGVHLTPQNSGTAPFPTSSPPCFPCLTSGLPIITNLSFMWLTSFRQGASPRTSWEKLGTMPNTRLKVNVRVGRKWGPQLEVLAAAILTYRYTDPSKGLTRSSLPCARSLLLPRLYGAWVSFSAL